MLFFSTLTVVGGGDMKHFKFFKIGIFILSFLLIATTVFADLPDEWTEIDPEDYGFEFNGLTPACSNAPNTPDDKFTFFVKFFN